VVDGTMYSPIRRANGSAFDAVTASAFGIQAEMDPRAFGRGSRRAAES